MTERGTVGNSNHHTMAEAKDPDRKRERAQALDVAIASLREEADRMRLLDREVFVAKLSAGTTVTISTAGPFGRCEVERLISMLKTQRDVLVEAETQS